jgi:hypothetical protein
VFPGRLVSVALATILTALVAAVASPDMTAATAPHGLGRFKEAVGHVESGGRYTARNRTSGAYGKYQILPSNWPTWARQYLGSASAPQTPRNQERVASGKMASLIRWLGTWRRVAYWWLTGSSRTSGWSSYARRYVDRVMTRYTASAARTGASARTRVVSDRSRSIVYRGTWRTARHAGYNGDRVRYATGRGASATLTFTGRRVVWYGPTGPTRGKARVYVDGKAVRTVDLRRRSFDPRAALYSTRWSKSGRHTLRIVVLGTTGRPMVAIDDFAITR